jgi:uncharacterized repeat protein (TIGR03803 family)
VKIRRERTCALIFISAFWLCGCFGAFAQVDAPRPLKGGSELSDGTGNADRAKDPGGYDFQLLYTFCSEGGVNCTDGLEPQSALVQDSAGNLYGTTTLGGANGAGTVFEVDTAGNETVLYSFCSQPGCLDGELPYSTLVMDSAGNLYGTTSGGGAHGFYGTVFELDGAGQETVLYSFCSVGNCVDGAVPQAGLIFDAEGNLYGTTSKGGAYSYSNGTVFELNAAGQETVLYSFCPVVGCADGSEPYSGLVRDSMGNLYGTTSQGGKENVGTVFKIDPAGQETVLWSFCSEMDCADGMYVYAGLIEDAEGNLYGTTKQGGAHDWGVVFELNAAGEETVLYSFCALAKCKDGYYPWTGVVQDSAGNLYGTTTYGGKHGAGAVFKVTKAGKETVLYSFCTIVDGKLCLDGGDPNALMLDAEGSLYGTTVYNGANDAGTVFKLSNRALGTPIVTLSSSPNPSAMNQSVAFSVAVSGSGVTPTGSVVFKEGKTTLGTVTLTDGQAELATAFAKSGTFSIVAEYSGDENYKAKNSKPLKQVVEK